MQVLWHPGVYMKSDYEDLFKYILKELTFKLVKETDNWDHLHSIT